MPRRRRADRPETLIAADTEGDDSIDSYAECVLIDIEELYFDDVKYEF